MGTTGLAARRSARFAPGAIFEPHDPAPRARAPPHRSFFNRPPTPRRPAEAGAPPLAIVAPHSYPYALRRAPAVSHLCPPLLSGQVLEAVRREYGVRITSLTHTAAGGGGAEAASGADDDTAEARLIYADFLHSHDAARLATPLLTLLADADGGGGDDDAGADAVDFAGRESGGAAATAAAAAVAATERSAALARAATVELEASGVDDSAGGDDDDDAEEDEEEFDLPPVRVRFAPATRSRRKSRSRTS